ncbi:Ubiquinol-cytochrome C reductase hinge protein [Ancylostoma caninum]|uniref:Ubiquinol-cytochrome C reductase hinge protein n=1 Tax=Ancylostoma caninum TaxID=29170 RepID=A0A368GDQ2_ANCCA|nr:Ubiquinol-cytochrome C reductase hinge protein [Ancylostoma caninum]
MNDFYHSLPICLYSLLRCSLSITVIFGWRMPEHNEPLEEGVDQLTQWRERCADHVADFKALLDECNDRVNSRSNTDEVCHQEMTDFVHHLDECAMPKAFAALK